MNKNGKIIIIEDDRDDQELIEIIYKKLNYRNELVFLENGEVAIKYLNEMKKAPFLIISDINMPKIDGIELRKRVQNNKSVNIMCIPYIMLTTTATKQTVDSVYSVGVQGYFQKPASAVELADILSDIIKYWKRSFTPGSYMTA